MPLQYPGYLRDGGLLRSKGCMSKTVRIYCEVIYLDASADADIFR